MILQQNHGFYVVNIYRAFYFAGFSKLENVDIAVTRITLPPEDVFAVFDLNFTIPAVITGKFENLLLFN